MVLSLLIPWVIIPVVSTPPIHQNYQSPQHLGWSRSDHPTDLAEFHLHLLLWDYWSFYYDYWNWNFCWSCFLCLLSPWLNCLHLDYQIGNCCCLILLLRNLWNCFTPTHHVLTRFHLAPLLLPPKTGFHPSLLGVIAPCFDAIRRIFGHVSSNYRDQHSPSSNHHNFPSNPTLAPLFRFLARPLRPYPVLPDQFLGLPRWGSPSGRCSQIGRRLESYSQSCSELSSKIPPVPS